MIAKIELNKEYSYKCYRVVVDEMDIEAFGRPVTIKLTYVADNSIEYVHASKFRNLAFDISNECVPMEKEIRDCLSLAIHGRTKDNEE
jgi:hypothetical protein